MCIFLVLFVSSCIDLITLRLTPFDKLVTFKDAITHTVLSEQDLLSSGL